MVSVAKVSWSPVAPLVLAAALVHASPSGSQSSNGVLDVVASMSDSRAAHTATALADGRVLIVGGFSERGVAMRAEAYEPVARRFVALPRTPATRQSHTATRLRDGKVLLAGGYGEGTATLASAELFDPATNAFLPTGSLHAARAGHVAVLLDRGQVLLLGGVGPEWTILSSAELYDPATGRFTRAGDMTVARESHVAVRLSDGRVLIAGGHNGERRNLTLLTSAEIYAPTTGTFSRVAEMNVRRHKHDAIVLPNGQVLITGGTDERDDRGVYDSTELFDPKTARFTAGPAMTLARYKHAGTSMLLPNGLVIIAGGAARAETYDPRTDRFALVPGETRMAGQFSAVAGLRNGGALVTGGYGNGTGPRASAWAYTP